MKKQNVYVPIANKKEAKRAKAVLEAMGEKIFHMFMPMDDKDIYLLFEDDCWLVGCKAYERKEITLKQLIEILVSEQKEPEKIAVRVDNEKEFNALMKYYDSLGWKWRGGEKPNELTFDSEYSPFSLRFNDSFTHSKSIQNAKILPFSEFAKEHGIRVPLLVSEDGVELFDGDEYTCVYKHGGAWHKGVDGLILKIDNNCVENPQESKAFSNRQAALDWIEAQKPKVIEYSSEFGIKCQITKDEALLTCGCGCFSITKKDINYIHKAMEELNS